MHKNLALKSLFVSSLLVLSGCSTVFNSGSQAILAHPSTKAKDVEVIVESPSGSYATTLPTTITAESSYDDVKVRIIDKCYDNVEVKVGKNITPSFYANALVWPAFFVDLATGKYWKYDSHVTVPLTKQKNCQ
ncbi:hypothetical protein C942_04256 [Photobacterium marinum]|uniref:Lipoprotein n=1 Tax=Photobacterium marinum TaxID=1056511 RepID=L8JE54_9GAMM|nr:hypothetical protein [Photobacterium marinum]ELR66558.1 hypothetical protein C942_04256 [Photobacterium marinum]